MTRPILCLRAECLDMLKLCQKVDTMLLQFTHFAFILSIFALTS